MTTGQPIIEYCQDSEQETGSLSEYHFFGSAPESTPRKSTPTSGWLIGTKSRTTNRVELG